MVFFFLLLLALSFSLSLSLYKLFILVTQSCFTCIFHSFSLILLPLSLSPPLISLSLSLTVQLPTPCLSMASDLVENHLIQNHFRNRYALHENSVSLSSTTNPKPNAVVISCSGKPNLSKRLSHLHVHVHVGA